MLSVNRSRTLPYLFCLLAAILTSACGESNTPNEIDPDNRGDKNSDKDNPGSGNAVDTTAPVIISKSAQSNVAIDGLVSVTFNETLDCTSVNARNFYVDGVSTQQSCSGTTVSLQPDASLAYASDYKVHLSGGPDGVSDLAGNHLQTGQVWTITTVAAPDTVAPEVLTTSESIDVAIDAAIWVRFSETIDCTSVNTNNFYITGVSGSYQCQGDQVSLQPDTALAYAQTYQAHITSGTSAIRDLAGNTIQNAHSWSLTTVSEPDTTAPQVVDTGAVTNVALDAAITIRFSEAIDCASVNSGNFFIDGVSGNYQCQDNQVSLQPQVALLSQQTYQAHVTAGAGAITDLAGNSVQTPRNWSFITVAAADTTAPQVVDTGPVIDVAVNAAITIGFSEAIDCSTVNSGNFFIDGISGNYLCQDNQVSLQPQSALQYQQTYQAHVTAGAGAITDLAGNSVQTSRNWSFTTVAATDTTAPQVVDNGAGVPLRVQDPLTIRFDEAIDCNSVNSGNFYIDGVSGSYQCSGDQISLRPDTALQYAQTYQAHLSAGSGAITDLAGNPLADALDWSFTTVASSNAFSFIAYGDSRADSTCTGNAVHIGLVSQIDQEQADFVVHLGDMIAGGFQTTNWVENGDCTGETDYGSFKQMIAPLQNWTPVPGLKASFYPVIGNHDDNWGSGWYPDFYDNTFCDVFDPRTYYPNHTQQSYYTGAPKFTDDEFYSRACTIDVKLRQVYPRLMYYSFNHHSTHFVVLRINDDRFNLMQCNACLDQSNYDDYVNIHQLQWLQQDLAAASSDNGIDNIIVFLHAPIYTLTSAHEGTRSRDLLASEFSKYGVKAVFSGHNHMYERSLPITATFDANNNPVATQDNTNGTRYFVTGGGGSPLHTQIGPNAPRVEQGLMAKVLPNYHYIKIEIDGTSISTTAIDNQGKVIDQAQF